MVSSFLRRYRELSRRSTIAFWLVMVTAGLSLTITAIGFDGGYRSPTLDTLQSVCTFVMFVSLGVLCVGQIVEDRRRTR